MRESSINKFHYGDKDKPSIFHTNCKSIADAVLARNPECKLISDCDTEYMIQIPNTQVRHPALWVKKVGVMEEEEVVVDEEEDIQDN